MNDWYPWLTAPYRQLIDQYGANKNHHALLLYSSVECGLTLLVNTLARWLMCQQPKNKKICGQCHGCRLMDAVNHPDYHLLIPEKNKITIGVQQVRQLTEVLNYHAQQDGIKIVCLPQAEQLSEAAANALLKTLEEPPADTCFILCCNRPEIVLPTIRSRCSFRSLAVPLEKDSLEWLAKQQIEKVEIKILLSVLRLCAGSPLEALSMLKEQGWQQRANLLNAFVDAQHNNDFLSLLNSLSGNNVVNKLTWISTLWLDAIKYQYGVLEQIINQDSLSIIQMLATNYTPQRLQDYCRQWLACRYQLVTVPSINQELMLTHLLYQQ